MDGWMESGDPKNLTEQKKKKITSSQNFFKINLFLFQKYTPPVYKIKLLDNT